MNPLLITLLATATASETNETQAPVEPPPTAEVKQAERKPFKVKPLSWKREGTAQSFRVILWGHLWGRVQQLNPGSVVNGNERDVTANVTLRRARVILGGRPAKGIFIHSQWGVNNQTFTARSPQAFVHDFNIQYDGIEQFNIGAGLHYFNGVSRLANLSTPRSLTLDSPIFPWVAVNRTDQAVRNYGIFAKGKISRIDYRVSLNRPFAPSTSLADGGPPEFRPDQDSWMVAGYAKLELADREANTVPFLAGTYLGAKKVINFGAGAQWHPNALGTLQGDEVVPNDLLAIGADVFVDVPVGDGAFTGYGLYQYTNYGEGYIRNVGIVNPGSGGTSFAGGNAYPTMGTGHTAYVQAGYMLPVRIGSTGRLQPYGSFQSSFFDALGAPVVVGEAGINWYLFGQATKITAHWRNRPVFEADGSAQSGRANEGIVQLGFFY